MLHLEKSPSKIYKHADMVTLPNRRHVFFHILQNITLGDLNQDTERLEKHTYARVCLSLYNIPYFLCCEGSVAVSPHQPLQSTDLPHHFFIR